MAASSSHLLLGGHRQLVQLPQGAAMGLNQFFGPAQQVLGPCQRPLCIADQRLGVLKQTPIPGFESLGVNSGLYFSMLTTDCSCR